MTASELAKTPVNAKLESHYHLKLLAGYQNQKASVGGDIPKEQAATIHLLDEPGPDEGQARGKEILLIENAGIALDGYLLRHIILRNSTVVYSGQATRLEDVTFVNCTFVLMNNANTRAFAVAVLQNSKIGFRLEYS